MLYFNVNDREIQRKTQSLSVNQVNERPRG